MDKNQIEARAREYCAREKEARFRAEVEKLLAEGNFTELEDRFYQRLEFGTGGLRGIIAGGLNRMNTLVVKSATQGLATYVAKAFPDKAAQGALAAVIAYDCRHYSKEFAEGAACVFAANGIKTYLFSALRPTPELSYAIRVLKADTGIVVTASHNPPAYNGYKAYWNDGSQVIEPHDAGIIKEVNAVRDIKELDYAAALAAGLVKIIDKEIDEPFHKMITSHLFRPALVKEKAGEVKIVYTPLHGTGAMHVEAVLGSIGLRVDTVPEQREGNGDFPTVQLPNPEDPAALKMGIELAKKLHADVVMATDPDADRFGVAVPCGGDFVPITGNQMGCLLLDYVCLSLKELGKMPAKPAFVLSVVTSDMQKRVGALYGVEALECLTGFKWIADIMRKAEEGSIDRQIVFGDEESYGYLVENEVRDKDGISAAAICAEMTIYWRTQGKSLIDRLHELYAQCGYWMEAGISKYFEGPQGASIMAGLLDNFRKNPPKTFGGIGVEKIRDLEASIVRYMDTGKTEKVELPKSDVLQFYLKNGTVISARPSGTEPKIKFYINGYENIGAGGLDAAKQELGKKFDAIKAEINKALS
ncbi:MAG: phospho-sugar mutase [Spirochaetaceae bacterium]|jgi:phosphoglucomutase|nr:phospho-sugar mutase [Spirochaetaceae bacterium]